MLRGSRTRPRSRPRPVSLFHGFSDRSRLAIVQHLLLGEHRVVDLPSGGNGGPVLDAGGVDDVHHARGLPSGPLEPR